MGLRSGPGALQEPLTLTPCRALSTPTHWQGICRPSSSIMSNGSLYGGLYLGHFTQASQQPVNQVVITPLDGRGNRGPEKVSNWPKVTQLVHSRARSWTQSPQLQSLSPSHSGHPPCTGSSSPSSLACGVLRDQDGPPGRCLGWSQLSPFSRRYVTVNLSTGGMSSP